MKIGNEIKVTSSISTTEYLAFDISGRVTRSKQTTDGVEYGGGTDPTKWMTYGYNLAGALVEQQYPSGRKIRNELDASGDLAVMESKKNATSGPFHKYAFNFVYNAAGAVTSMELGNLRYESTEFNSRLQPTQIALGTSANATGLLKLNYSYNTTGNADNNGNVLSQDITVKRPGQSDLVFNQTYVYDDLNRLKVAEEKTGTTTNWKQTFVFDRYGNRRFDQPNTTQPASFANANLTNPTFNPTNNKFASGQNWSYDAAGNVTLDPEGRTFTYDAENKQTEVENSSSQTVGQYYFDGDGKRVKKVVPGTGEVTIFVYDAGGKLVAEYSTTVQQVEDAKVQYLTADNLGTPRINTDVYGTVTSRSDYMPYGEELTNQGGRSTSENYAADDVRQGFSQTEVDGETRLNNFGARYLNSNVGRFTSADPLLSSAVGEAPQSWNRYVYTRNNPLNLIDLHGLYTWGDGAVGDSEEAKRRRAAMKEWHQGVKDALAFYQKNPSKYSKQIGRLEKILGALGEEGKVGSVGIDIKIKFGTVKTPGASAEAGGRVTFGSGGKVTSATYEITFDSSKMKDLDAGVLAHESQHVVDMKAADDHSSIRGGRFRVSDPFDLRRYDREDRGMEAAQMVYVGTGTSEIGPLEGSLYSTSWESVDEKTMETNLKTARVSALYKRYGMMLYPVGNKSFDRSYNTYSTEYNRRGRR